VPGLNPLTDRIQGPQAVAAVQRLTKIDLSRVFFGQSVRATIAGSKVTAARTGYTGEDGLEVCLLLYVQRTILTRQNRYRFRRPRRPTSPSGYWKTMSSNGLA
jgi:glycine cleavage system aminomethyltransferase T